MCEVRNFSSSDAPKACKTAKSHDMPREPQAEFAVPWAAVCASPPICTMPSLPPLSALYITRALYVHRWLSAARSLRRAARTNPCTCGARTCGAADVDDVLKLHEDRHSMLQIEPILLARYGMSERYRAAGGRSLML